MSHVNVNERLSATGSLSSVFQHHGVGTATQWRCGSALSAVLKWTTLTVERKGNLQVSFQIVKRETLRKSCSAIGSPT